MKLALKQYLVKLKMEHGISAKYFAKKILRCSENHLTGIIMGRNNCSKRLAEDIEKATKGEVTKEYMMAKNVIKSQKNTYKGILKAQS